MTGRRTAALVLVVTATALTGCGGTHPATYRTDASALSRAFTTATGARLKRTGTPKDAVRFEEDAPPTGAPRFGLRFSLFVAKNATARDVVLDDPSGRVVPRGSDGLYRPTPLTVVKDYGDGVLLSAQPAVPAQLADLDAAVRAAITRDPTRVPTADRPCRAVGIDPARGKEGTCRLGATRITAVDAGHTARSGPIAATAVGVVALSVIPQLQDGYDRVRAKGRYLLARYRLENISDRPIDREEPGLIVGGKTYQGSSEAAIQLQGRRLLSPFPLQPGATAEVTQVFDLPEEVVAAAQTTGQLVFFNRDVDGSSTAARLRLAGAAPTSVAAARGPE